MMKFGFGEFIVIIIVAFVFIGPDNFPAYMRKFGKLLVQVKRYVNDATKEIKEPLEEITQPIQEVAQPFQEIKQDLTSTVTSVTGSIDNIGRKKPSKVEAAAEEVADEAVVELDETPAAAPAEPAPAAPAAAAEPAAAPAPAEEMPEELPE